MSNDLTLVKAYAYSLAKDLLVNIVIFKIDGRFGVMPADEYDGADDTIIRELDPFELGLAN